MLKELPAFPCPCCHERTFTKRRLDVDAPAAAGTVLTHLHVCQACGENYLSTVHVAPDRSRTETWDYYLERDTTLRRVRRYAPAGTHHLVEDEPLFVVGTEPVTEATWRAALAAVRGAPSPLLADAPVPSPALSTFVERWLAWWAETAAPLAPAPRPALPVHFGAAGHRAA